MRLEHATGEHTLDRRRDLAITVVVVLGLSLAILVTAVALRWFEADWSAACHRLLRAPAPPRFATPWRLGDLRPPTPCFPRRP